MRVAVAGGGLAGVAAAWALSDRAEVVLMAPRGIGDGASGVAAGLVNPFMGRKANPAWRWRHALAATDRFLGGAPTGLLRPASSAHQARAFAAQAARHLDALAWLGAEQTRAAYPSVSAPHGALLVRGGRAVEVASALRRVASRTGVAVTADALAGWHERGGGVTVETGTAAFDADALVVATGAAWTSNAPGDVLHPVKGQLALLDAPAPLPLPVSGGVYLAPSGPHVVAGSTFEHDFRDLAVDSSALADLHARAARLVPALAGARVAGGRAGIRVTTPGSRLPLAGAVTPGGRVWCLTGLGAKGLLMAPLCACLLARALVEGAPLPAEIDARERLELPGTYAWRGGSGPNGKTPAGENLPGSEA